MKKIHIKIINENKTERIEEEKIKWILEKIAEKYSTEAVELAVKQMKSKSA